MWSLSSKVESLANTGRYDVDELLNALHLQLDQLNFFYDILVSKEPEQDPNKTYYSLYPNPKEHQLIYVALGRGYPKELFDVHWCYVLRHCGTKLLVIPTTSLKPSSSIIKKDYFFDILEDSGNTCRLRFNEIRVIDKMRVVKHKKYKEVITDRNEIESALGKYLNFKYVDEINKTLEIALNKTTELEEALKSVSNENEELKKQISSLQKN